MKIISDKKLKEIKIYKPTVFQDKRGKIWTKWDKKNFLFKPTKFDKGVSYLKNINI